MDKIKGGVQSEEGGEVGWGWREKWGKRQKTVFETIKFLKKKKN